MIGFGRGLAEIRNKLDVGDGMKLGPLLDVTGDAWEIADRLAEDAETVDELVDVILTQHREFHTEVSPKFCTLICQLAAAL